MSQQSSETSRDPRRNSWLVLVLLVMIVIPATIALNTVQFPGTLQISNSNPTPFGYTLSLSLFIIPIIVIGGWLVPSERLAFPRRAFWWTLGLLVPVSFGLDFTPSSSFPTRGPTLVRCSSPGWISSSGRVCVLPDGFHGRPADLYLAG